ncbi:PREDICTED: neurogenic locus Notch protein-like isoform X4 [Acropora digitifera]|uniref:neurogenic locus Notch protein-like isoform X4 n=1 Tax=Acropora digitifera TaxID=70779 RepID=UPI00077B0C54|nr:PREDICTED: neurogenic locus Notch protein-like isoform X4 [Acropora digitifera]
MRLLLVAVAFCSFTKTECCKVKTFLEPIQGKVLKGHLIKTLFVKQEGMCQARCFMNDMCQSTNVSPQLDNGQWRCELNDAGGLENLNDEAGHVYYLTKNACNSSPCIKNATCRPSFQLDDDSYTCACPAGFAGAACNEDIDECKDELHNCSSDESCANQIGSFICLPESTGCDGSESSQLKNYKGYSASNPALSCAEVLENRPESKSDAYYLKTEDGGVARTYCHMENIQGCGGGGWTLVMKIDGAKTTFSYDSDLWTNKMPLNQSSGKSGFDHDETKMPSFWSTPFTKLCLGMQAAGQETNWITVSYKASSLHSLMSNNTYHETRVSRGRWKSLVADSSLQINCNMEGFNVKPSGGENDAAVTRIGILGDNGNNCGSCNSRIGFGSKGLRLGQHDDNSCGNECVDIRADNGEKHIKANCFILLQ